MQQWQGPLPPPAALEHFNQVIPNGADRIVAMVEREQAARITNDSKALAGAIWDNRLGKVFGFLLSIASVGGAVYVAAIGGSAFVSIALVSLPVMAAVRAFMGRGTKK